MQFSTPKERIEHSRIRERDWRLGILWRFGQFGRIAATIGAITLLIALAVLAFSWRIILGFDHVKSDRPSEDGIWVITTAMALLVMIPVCGLVYQLSAVLQDLAFWLADLSDDKWKWYEIAPLEGTPRIARGIRRLTFMRVLIGAGWFAGECSSLLIQLLAILGAVGLLYSGAMYLIVGGANEAIFESSPMSIAFLSLVLLLVAGIANLTLVALRDTRARFRRNTNKPLLISD